MPLLPMYVTEQDAPVLIELLSQDPEIAFLVADGPKRWRAVQSFAPKSPFRIGLWHIPSGPLPLLLANQDHPPAHVLDPWAGWNEERTGADPTTPYFGPGHPGVFWLNLRLGGVDAGSCCGLSSFEWIGNHYRLIGNGAAESTELWWKLLRRQISRIARKVPRQGLSGTAKPEIFAFPHAHETLAAGANADANPRPIRWKTV